MSEKVNLVRLAALAKVAAAESPPPAWMAKWQAEAAEAMPQLLAMLAATSRSPCCSCAVRCARCGAELLRDLIPLCEELAS